MSSKQKNTLIEWGAIILFASPIVVPLLIWRNSELHPPVTVPTATPKPYVFPSKDPFGGQPEGVLAPSQRLRMWTKQIAGRESIFCGFVSSDKPERIVADACAVKAFRARKPFRLMYDGSNGFLSYEGIAGNIQGQIFFLSNRQMTNGINNYTIDETLDKCKSPIVVKINGHERLTCREKRNLAPYS